MLGIERVLQPGQAAQRDPRRGLPGPLRRDELAKQRGHRRALIGEYPDIALRAGEDERPGQGIHRSPLLAPGGQRQRPQRADRDQAARPVLGGRRHVQPGAARQAPARASPRASRTRTSTRY